MEVHVNDTTGPDVGHFIGENGTNFSELSWLNFVTTIFREEDWNCQICKFFSSVFVTRGLEGLRTTPFVHVNTIEISLDIVITTSEEICRWNSGVCIIVSRVTNRDISVTLLRNVRLHVSDCSLDVRCRIGVGGVGDNFVTCEETKNVIILLHHVNDTGVSFVQRKIPTWSSG